MISLGAALPDGLELVVEAGRVTVPRWNLTVEAVGLSASDADRVADLLDAADAPPVLDELEIPVITEDTTLPVDVPDTADAVSEGDGEARWEPPVWPVTVRLLAGAPRVAAAGGELRVKPQPLAGLAYLALYREVALDELRWRSGATTSKSSPSDCATCCRSCANSSAAPKWSAISKTASFMPDPISAATSPSSKRSPSGHVRFPARRASTSAAMVDLVEGQPFAYPSSAAAYWRWVDLSHLHAVWQHHRHGGIRTGQAALYA